MNRSGLWTVITVATAWTGFLIGYAVSAHTSTKPVAVAKAETGGYGCVPQKGAAPSGIIRLPPKGASQ